VHPNADQSLIAAITVHQKRLRDWTLKTTSGKAFDLAACARTVSAWVDNLRTEVIPETWPRGAVIEHPRILLTFAVLRLDVLGHYRPQRNQHGLLWEVGLNPRAMTRRADAETAAVLLHELLHVCEHVAGEPPAGRRGYHSSQFRGLAEQLGIPCSKHGREQGILSDSPFSRWAKRHNLSLGGCSFLRDASHDEGRGAPDAPKRVAWVCDCGFRVWVPRAQILNARCITCESTFRRKG
jgi:hypothetical protein